MRAVVVAGASLVFMAGCTFLVTFDDIAQDDSGIGPGPDKPDVGAGDTGSSSSSGSSSGGQEDVFVPPPGDGGIDFSKVCANAADGKYCNGHGIPGADGGSSDDLVTCLNKKTVKVERCSNNCFLQTFSGFHDECDQCKTVAGDGYYCGDEFIGWAPANKRIKFRCLGGNINSQMLCNNTCSGPGPGALCQ